MVRLEVIAPDCRKRVDLVDYKLVVDVHADLPDPVLQRQLKSLDEGLVLRPWIVSGPPIRSRKILRARSPGSLSTTPIAASPGWPSTKRFIPPSVFSR